MGSIITILTLLEPLLSQMTGIISKAVAANLTNDQATLDALHNEAIALANSLAPTGTTP
jgi:hypothetical protein